MELENEARTCKVKDTARIRDGDQILLLLLLIYNKLIDRSIDRGFCVRQGGRQL